MKFFQFKEKSVRKPRWFAMPDLQTIRCERKILGNAAADFVMESGDRTFAAYYTKVG